MFEEAIRTIVREELRPLRQVLEALKPPSPLTELMTAIEAAELARRSPETIRAWVRVGKLKRYGANGRLLVSRADLLQLLETQPSRVSEDDLEQMAVRMTGRR